jgi:acyl-CoA thioester hydrolase
MIKITDRVRFVETDLMAVVHHSNYLRWFEMGRVEYLRQAGIDLNDLRAAGYLFPITKVQCEYKQSAYFDDEYEVRTTLTAASRAKMVFSYEVVRIKDGALLVTGSSQNVFTGVNGKIARLPAEYFDKIKKAYDEEKEHKS